MDELTTLVKKNIKQKYSSTKKFADELGIPQTTIVSAVKNGIGGTSFSTVCKICKALDIKILNGIYPLDFSENMKNFIDKMSKLDEKGLHTLITVLEMEYIRCMAESELSAIAAKNSNQETKTTYPIVNADQIPSKASVNDFLIALNDDDDALNS